MTVVALDRYVCVCGGGGTKGDERRAEERRGWQREASVLVGELVRGLGPRANKPAPVVMAETKRVGSRESHDLLVIESHAVEHVAKVLGTKRSVREATIRRHTLGGSGTKERKLWLDCGKVWKGRG